MTEVHRQSKELWRSLHTKWEQDCVLRCLGGSNTLASTYLTDEAIWYFVSRAINDILS